MCSHQAPLLLEVQTIGGFGFDFNLENISSWETKCQVVNEVL
jgi:hypothetical protein